MKSEYDIWRNAGKKWAECPIVDQVLKVVNSEEIDPETHSKELGYKNRKAMLLGFFWGVRNYIVKNTRKEGIKMKKQREERLRQKKEMLMHLIESIRDQDSVSVQAFSDDITGLDDTSYSIHISRNGKNRDNIHF